MIWHLCDLTAEEKLFLCEIIDRTKQSKIPADTYNILGCFRQEFVEFAINQQMKDSLTEEGKDLANKILEKIKL